MIEHEREEEEEFATVNGIRPSSSYYDHSLHSKSG